MSIPTVYLVGTERLPLIPEYLNLGTIVVVSPDQPTLDAWERQRRPTEESPGGGGDPLGTVVDLAGRRIVCGEGTLPLSDLEFRVLGALLDPPGRALTFREIRLRGWGAGPELAVDIYSVRALIQRLRAKLQAAGAPLAIASVRGYGFRADLAGEGSHTGARRALPA